MNEIGERTNMSNGEDTLNKAVALGVTHTETTAQLEELLTDYLMEYLKLRLETEEYVDRELDRNDYSFLRAEGGWFHFYTDDYSDQYGEWVGFMEESVPFDYIRDPQKFAKKRREEYAIRMGKKFDEVEKDRLIRIAKLKKELESLEGSKDV